MASPDANETTTPTLTPAETNSTLTPAETNSTPIPATNPTTVATPDDKPTATTSTAQKDTATSSCKTASCIKTLIVTGAYDFRTVFFYPLCTGIMTGIGFIVGKRIGERYFYGAAAKSA